MLLLFTHGKIENQHTSLLMDADVVFDYEISSVNYESSSFKIKGTITNNTNDTINLLTYSCHGLKSNITTEDTVIKQYYWWHCNGSVPEVFQLLPNSSENIESDFKILEFNTDFNIGFKFNRFDKYYTRDELMDISMNKDVYYYFEDIILESKTIWGKPKRIKK